MWKTGPKDSVNSPRCFLSRFTSDARFVKYGFVETPGSLRTPTEPRESFSHVGRTPASLRRRRWRVSNDCSSPHGTAVPSIGAIRPFSTRAPDEISSSEPLHRMSNSAHSPSVDASHRPVRAVLMSLSIDTNTSSLPSLCQGEVNWQSNRKVGAVLLAKSGSLLDEFSLWSLVFRRSSITSTLPQG